MTTIQAKHYGTAQWKKLRVQVLSRDGHICAYCGQEAHTVDHVVPLSRGGAVYDLENLVACCSRCNSRKRDKSEAFFLSDVLPPLSSRHDLSPSTTATTPNAPIAIINE